MKYRCCDPNCPVNVSRLAADCPAVEVIDAPIEIGLTGQIRHIGSIGPICPLCPRHSHRNNEMMSPCIQSFESQSLTKSIEASFVVTTNRTISLEAQMKRQINKIIATNVVTNLFVSSGRRGLSRFVTIILLAVILA